MNKRKRTFENIVENGENSNNHHFLLLTQSLLLFIYSFLIHKAFADDKIFESFIEMCFGEGRKLDWKRRKYWLPAFMSFSHNVFKGLLYKGGENLGLFGK